MGSGCCCSSSSTAGLQVLIQAAVEQLEAFNTGEGVEGLTPVTMGLVSAATLAADTTFHLALTDANPKKFIQIVNRTDGDIYASLDNSNNHFHITSGSSQTLSLGSNRTSWSGNVYVKQDTSNPPVTDGNVEVSAYY